MPFTSFLNDIQSLGEQYKQCQPSNTTEELEKFENLCALDELKIALSSSPLELETNLKAVFTTRWNRIRHSSMCYTEKPLNAVNQLYLNVAKTLYPIPEGDEDAIDALPDGEGPYCLLMPSLTTSTDIYRSNIHQYPLTKIILSDDERLFIPIDHCLEHATESGTGRLEHVVTENGEYLPLTPTEIQRLHHHSTHTQSYLQAVINFNIERLEESNFIPQLQKLSEDLRAGGTRQQGVEFDSGGPANAGIVAFAQYWEKLSQETQNSLYQKHNSLQEYLGRLMRPLDANYREVSYCVELIASNLESIIRRANNNNIRLILLKQLVTQKQEEFNNATQESFCSNEVSSTKPPRVLMLLFTLLDADTQRHLLREHRSTDAWMHALQFAQENLPDFMHLSSTTKQRAVHTVFTDGKTPLMIAVENGDREAVNCLLTLGIDNLIAKNPAGENVLTIAEQKHPELLEPLLMAATNLTIASQENLFHNMGTALHWAIRLRKKDLVDALLLADENIETRNSAGENALDVAQRYSPDLQQRILSHGLSTLNAEQQKTWLSNIDNGKYQNIGTYLLIKQPLLANQLLNLDDRPNGAEIQTFLNGIQFNEHFYKIKNKWLEMQSKAKTNSNYQLAASTAETLTIRLTEEYIALFQSNEPFDDTMKLHFKAQCTNHIQEAMPVLKQHRGGWKHILTTLLIALTFPISLPLYACGFFNTKSHNLLLAMKESINQNDHANSSLI